MRNHGRRIAKVYGTGASRASRQLASRSLLFCPQGRCTQRTSMGYQIVLTSPVAHTVGHGGQFAILPRWTGQGCSSPGTSCPSAMIKTLDLDTCRRETAHTTAARSIAGGSATLDRQPANPFARKFVLDAPLGLASSRKMLVGLYGWYADCV